MVPGHLVSSPLKTGLVFTLEYLRVYGGPVSWPSGSLGVWSLASVGVHNNYVKQTGNPQCVPDAWELGLWDTVWKTWSLKPQAFTLEMPAPAQGGRRLPSSPCTPHLPPLSQP